MINRTLDVHGALPGDDAVASGVSWGAILAGAFAAAALSFVLIILGFGLGFSSVSPWSGSGVSAQTIGISTILWITFTQIAASAIGGYMAGRLRVKWASVHTDEVYFRDTAHGFLAWSVATLVTAALLTSAIGGVLSGGAKVAGAAGATAMTAGATAAGAGMGSMGGNNGAGASSGYFIDTLFRPAPPAGAAAAAAPAASADAATAGTTGTTGTTGTNAAANAGTGNNGNDAAQRAEVARIFANALRNGANGNGGLSDGDRVYVAQVLAARTGMSQADAEKRVSDTYASYSKAINDAENNAKAAAEKARKAAAYGSLWMFVALLCGAFIASLSATFGGRLRDRSELIAVRTERESVTGYPTTNATL